jgi:hypothetical protein
MFKIEYVIPIMMSYRLLFLELLKYKKEDTTKNIVNSVNCFVFMLSHYFNRDSVYITHAVIGFYAYDLISLITSCLQYNNSNNSNNNDSNNDNHKDKQIKNQNQNQKQNIPYMIHHILTILICHNTLYNNKKQILWEGYYILEKSNVMLYVSYHFHKEYKNNKNLLYVTDFIQLIFYSYYRVIAILLHIYSIRYEIYEEGLIFIISIALIYIMGLVWSYKLTAINIKNYRSYISFQREVTN